MEFLSGDDLWLDEVAFGVPNGGEDHGLCDSEPFGEEGLTEFIGEYGYPECGDPDTRESIV